MSVNRTVARTVSSSGIGGSTPTNLRISSSTADCTSGDDSKPWGITFKSAWGMSDATYCVSSTSLWVMCWSRSSVGTFTDGSTCRISVSYQILWSSLATSGVAVWRLSFAYARISSSVIEAAVYRLALGPDPGTLQCPPVPHLALVRLHLFRPRPPRVIRAPDASRGRAPPDDGLNPLGAARGEERVRCPALEHACKHGSFRFDGIEDDA